MEKKTIDIEQQIRQEITTMRLMIAIYCKGNHPVEDDPEHKDLEHENSQRKGPRHKDSNREDSKNKRSKRKLGDLCPECTELFDYTLSRIDACPVRSTKDFCSNCTIHCYQPNRREQIRVVMRYSGPRMIYHNFPMAMRHLISTRKSKRATQQLPKDTSKDTRE